MACRARIGNVPVWTRRWLPFARATRSWSRNSIVSLDRCPTPATSATRSPSGVCLGLGFSDLRPDRSGLAVDVKYLNLVDGYTVALDLELEFVCAEEHVDTWQVGFVFDVVDHDGL